MRGIVELCERIARRFATCQHHASIMSTSCQHHAKYVHQHVSNMPTSCQHHAASRWRVLRATPSVFECKKNADTKHHKRLGIKLAPRVQSESKRVEVLSHYRTDPEPSMYDKLSNSAVH